VIRRPTGITGEVGDFYLAFQELQCWVNDLNLLQSTSTTKTANFANFFIDKEVDLTELQITNQGLTHLASNIYDNEFSRIFDTHSKENNSDANISLIIRNIPLTSIETIQSLVLYNRTGEFNNTTIGVAIELYNSTSDPNLSTILATTAVITTAVNVYRFDFPSIDTYTGSFATGDSLTLIRNDTHSTKQVVSVSASPPIQITCDVVVSGDLTAENLFVGSTNLITDITALQTLTAGHTDDIASNTNNIALLDVDLFTEQQKTSALQTLTAGHTTGIASLDTRLDTEEPKTSALQTLTANHSTDIASNTANILTKQATITIATDLTCNSLTTLDLEVNGNIILD
jgi:hypothetical protein